jgi:hypothetical protein
MMPCDRYAVETSQEIGVTGVLSASTARPGGVLAGVEVAGVLAVVELAGGEPAGAAVSGAEGSGADVSGPGSAGDELAGVGSTGAGVEGSVALGSVALGSVALGSVAVAAVVAVSASTDDVSAPATGLATRAVAPIPVIASSITNVLHVHFRKPDRFLAALIDTIALPVTSGDSAATIDRNELIPQTSQSG